MKRYQPDTPRLTLAFTSIVMTLATAAVMVIAPANLPTDRDALLARMHAPATEVTIHPARIDVVATREHADTWKQASTHRATLADAR